MFKGKIIAFYLPQYHPIEENNEWWGEGFTDWRNVVKGKPRFKRHYQPHIPADLGFYDLRLEETRIAQADMAKKYGISGFCYYHYWFNGKMLLEKPFNDVLASGKPDFPFCLCWANENWTRRWDGLESEILIEQNYGEYNVKEHLKWLKDAFNDHRYIKIEGKPLFLIYNTKGIPNVSDRLMEMRKYATEYGIKDLYLCSVKSLRNEMLDEDILKLGFDAIVEFYPNGEKTIPKKPTAYPRYIFNKVYNKLIKTVLLDKFFKLKTETTVHDYKKLVHMILRRQHPAYKLFPCVIPAWDNSARKRVSAVIQNKDASLFGKWLTKAIDNVKDYNPEEKIIFINAWNEWAEGCHLEPDIVVGKSFLEETAKVVGIQKES